MQDLPASPSRRAYLALVQVHELLTSEASALFRSGGLSLSQFNALRILVDVPEDGISCQEIAERLVHRVPDVTRLVDRLERAGLVTRKRCSTDRRVVRVSITAKGRELCESFYPDVASLHEKQFEGMSVEKIQKLDTLLRELLALRTSESSTAQA